MITVGQLRRLKRILIGGEGRAESVIKLLSEINNKELCVALSNELVNGHRAVAPNHYELAIATGKGNTSILEDKLFSIAREKIQKNSYSIHSYIGLSKVKNINVKKVQEEVISCDCCGIINKIIVLGKVTRIKGADINRSMQWYKDTRKSSKSTKIRKTIDDTIDSINRSYKFRSNGKKKTEYASEEQIQELLDLVEVKLVQEA